MSLPLRALRACGRHLLLALAVTSLMGLAPASAQPGPPAAQPAPPIAPPASADIQRPLHLRAVLSKDLLPYQQALRGLRDALPAGTLLDVVRPDELPGASAVDLTLAIGPEAATACRDLPPGAALFLMVLDPHRLALGSMPGVSLSVPVPLQLARIAAALPSVRRLGLLHDPRHNAALAQQAAQAAPGLGLRLVPLAVGGAQDIPGALDSASVDALWLVPDRTVVSRSSLDYLLRRAASARMPVVGFNRWFLRHGAVLALVIDYGAVGRQAAERALELLRGEAAPDLVEGPRRVPLLANLQTASRLGVRVQAAAVQEYSE